MKLLYIFLTHTFNHYQHTYLNLLTLPKIIQWDVKRKEIIPNDSKMNVTY